MGVDVDVNMIFGWKINDKQLIVQFFDHYRKLLDTDKQYTDQRKINGISTQNLLFGDDADSFDFADCVVSEINLKLFNVEFYCNNKNIHLIFGKCIGELEHGYDKFDRVWSVLPEDLSIDIKDKIPEHFCNGNPKLYTMSVYSC